MANASRPRKSSQRKTSSSTGLPARAATFDPLELYVTLVAGAENLSVTAARGLLHLRQAVIAAQKAAKGALIKLELYKDGDPDWYATAAKAPILRDIVSLLCLQLIDDFPTHAPALRRLLSQIQSGFDVCKQAFESRARLIRWAKSDSNEPPPDQWKDAAKKSRIDQSLLIHLSPVAVFAVKEMIAASMRLHRQQWMRSGRSCPICAGLPYARQGDQFLCKGCETRWPASKNLDCMCYPPSKWMRVGQTSAAGFEVLHCGNGKCTAYNLDPTLDAAFDPYFCVALVKLMAAPWPQSALQSPRG